MQKLLHFPKTASLIHNYFFPRPSSISSSLSQFSLSVSCIRSYESVSTSRCFSDIPMASSATVLPPPIDECLGRRFWNKYTNVWRQAMYTPFVVSLAAGNLKLDSFRHYIAQDVYFLRTFAKVLVIVNIFDRFSRFFFRYLVLS